MGLVELMASLNELYKQFLYRLSIVINGPVAHLSHSASRFLSISPTFCVSVCLSVGPSDCLSFCLTVCLSFCLSVYLSICTSVCLFVRLSVSLSVYKSHGVQERTLGQKKLSRPLTWWNVISNAFATYSAQRQKNRLGKIVFIA